MGPPSHTLENQSTSFGEVQQDMVVAKITGLPVRAEARLDIDVNWASGGGVSPPELRI